MTTYLFVKWLHVISGTVLFGTGVGIAFFKWMVDRTGDLRAIRIVNQKTVLADWVFTTPAVIIQPVTGLYLAYAAGYSVLSGWVLYAFCFYLVAGACWVPVVWLQIQMRNMAVAADAASSPLPARYVDYSRIWFWLGVPAFTALVIVFWLMVSKPSL